MRWVKAIFTGYFARTECISKAIQTFLTHTNEFNVPRQILNLGIGFDTLSLQLIQQNHSNLSLFELDFPEIIQKKTITIFKNAVLMNLLCGKEIGITNMSDYKIGDGYKIGNLCLQPVDLRNTTNLQNVLSLSNINPTYPTLIITECVLVYLDKSHSNKI